VDKLVADIGESFTVLSLVDQVTKILHYICYCMGQFLSLMCISIGQQSNAVCVDCFQSLLAYMFLQKTSKKFSSRELAMKHDKKLSSPLKKKFLWRKGTRC
jgi:hypothetical protein